MDGASVFEVAWVEATSAVPWMGARLKEVLQWAATQGWEPELLHLCLALPPVYSISLDRSLPLSGSRFPLTFQGSLAVDACVWYCVWRYDYS